jgi:pSer/pThr/pTyr-binding forkhead associated (FHA) protein
VVRDLDSRNGTLLNDEPLNEEQVLNPGDRLEVAGTVFLLTTSIYEIDGEGMSVDSSNFDPDAPTAFCSDLSSSGH